MTHKVFVSYHHANDQRRANHLRDYYGENNTLIDRSLDKEIDSLDNDYILSRIRTNHLKDSTVTIVLIGSETANRKWVDWEVYSSLRPYLNRSRNGLLAIFLPDAGKTPARLQENIDSGYAVTMGWSDISTKLDRKIEEAYNNRHKTELVRNGLPRRRRNG